MPIAKSERLTVLSNTEQEVLYGLPDFARGTADGVQRIADGAFKPASVQAMVGFQVPNGGLDGLATA